MSAIINVSTMPIQETELKGKPQTNLEMDTTKDNIEQQSVRNGNNKDIENETNNNSVSTVQLEKMAQQLQDFVGGMNKSLLFSVDQDSGRDVLKVIDSENGDIIKQYPSEEVLSIVAKLSEAAGTLVNEKI